MDAVLRQLLGDLTAAIRLIAHGNERPTGLEGVAMALAGGIENDLASRIEGGLAHVAESIAEHAQAVDRLAQALNRRT